LKRWSGKVVVNTHSTKAGAIGRVAAWFAGVDLISHTVHGFGFNQYQSYVKRSFLFVVEQFCTLLSDKIICVSQKDRLHGDKFLWTFKAKSLVIRAGVPLQRFYPAKLPKKKELIIGTISCLKPQKNIQDLISSFALLTRMKELTIYELRLEILGDGDQKSFILDLLQALGIRKKVKFLGWQSDVCSYIQKWDIFALSSLWEGLPCSVLEARLCQLPVVAYDVGGISEVIEHGKNGFLVEPGNKKQLTEYLAKLVKDVQLRKAMASFEDDLQLFSENKMLSDYEKLFKDLFAQKN
jgi:glycosyltransferase involved in cell wall biosynthesis